MEGKEQIDLEGDQDQDQEDQEQQQQQQQEVHVPSILPQQKKLMQNKSAKEVAQDLVYNKDKQLSSLKQIIVQFKHSCQKKMSSQQSSQQVGKGSNYIQSYIQRSIIQNQTSSQYEGQQEQSGSVLTKISQKLYQDLPNYIKQKYQAGCEQPCSINHSALRNQKDKGVFSSDVIDKTQGEMQKEQSIKEQSDWYENAVIGKQNQVQQKKFALAEEVKEKELRECTFQPQILPQEEGKEEDFWEKQMQLQQLYEERKEMLQKQVNSQQNSNIKKKPEISKETNQLADQHFKKNNISKPVFDRLYSTKNTYSNANQNNMGLPVKPNQNEKMIAIHSESTSAKKPKQQQPHNNAQTQPRENLLYLDAKRRQEQKQSSQKKEQQQQQNVHYESVYPNKNLINKSKQQQSKVQNKILSKKSNFTFNQMFLKEIIAYIKQICFPENQFENDEMLLDQSIGNQEYLQIMQLLRFVSPQYQNDVKSAYVDEQESLLSEIWNLVVKMSGKQLDNSDENSIVVRDFICVLMIFINFQMTKQGDFKAICLLTKELIPSIDSGLPNFLLQFPQVLNHLFPEANYKNKSLLILSKRFQTFCQNRLYASTSTNLRDELIQEEEEKYQYRPQISEISISLANQKKEKIKNEICELQNEIQSQNGISQLKEYDTNLLLGYQKLKSDQQKEKMRKEQEYNDLAECTFQPNISSFKGVKKSEELHAQAQSYHQSKKVERNTQDVEYEKNCDQCTFQPDVHFYQSSFSNTSRMNPSLHAEDAINKNINRIKEARHKKLLEEQIKMQGHTMNDNKRNIQQQTVELAEEDYITSLREHHPQPANQPNKVCQRNIQKEEKSNSSTDSEKEQVQENKIKYNKNPVNEINEQQGKEAEHLDNNGDDNQDEPAPLLFVDVNIEEGQASRIIVREGDTAPLLAASFAKEHSQLIVVFIFFKDLDASLQQKLEELLEQQIKNLLTKIEEEEEISENPNQFA